MTDVFAMSDAPSTIGRKALSPDFSPGEVNGTFYGTGEALLSAPYQAALGAAAGVNLLAAPIAGAFGQDAQDWWFSHMVDTPLRSIEDLNQRASTYGAGARVIGELGRIASEAAAGPIGVGAIEGLRRAGLEVRAGNDNAIALGSVTAATMALGFALPVTLPIRPGWGPALLQRMGFGVGSNVALGVAARGAEQALGEDQHALDGMGLTLDALLGAFFGGAAHVHARITGADAAMTLVEQASAARVVPPGESPQPYLDHLAAKQKAAAAGQDIPDPPVPAAAAKAVEDAARASEDAFNASDPTLRTLEAPGAGKPQALPVVDPPKPEAPAAKAGEPVKAAPAWEPVNADGEAVAFDLPALQQAAARLDAIGVKVGDLPASKVLEHATSGDPGVAVQILDAVSQCVMGYGH